MRVKERHRSARPATRTTPARTGHGSRHLDHLHRRGHLDHGGALRCGCGPEALAPDSTSVLVTCGALTTWQPVDGQHVGWQRAHFIYSDRMLDALGRPVATA
jgi:hypothetical protein